MDWVTLISAFGVSGILQLIITGFQNRKINKADYSQKIIDQSEQRVKQALEDCARMREERDAAYQDAKEQRTAKREWRSKHHDEQQAHHKTQLRVKDLEANLQEAEWFRCEIAACADRKPPREEKQE